MTALQAATPILWLLSGLVAGAGHFALLRWNTGLYLSRGSVLRAVTVQALRMAVTGVLLVIAAWHGSLSLLMAAIGVLLARMVVLRTTAIP
ncbi:MAG TPA: ATP synthase subunit I [Acetobacteraceae bacterium]|nr:ATP synthase subunit I [Acetobacteraceae bacterium]